MVYIVRLDKWIIRVFDEESKAREYVKERCIQLGYKKSDFNIQIEYVF